MIWPPHRVKMASTPSFLSALATRLPPEIFSLGRTAVPAAVSSEERSVDLSAAPAMMFILPHERHRYGVERSSLARKRAQIAAQVVAQIVLTDISWRVKRGKRGCVRHRFAVGSAQAAKRIADRRAH